MERHSLLQIGLYESEWSDIEELLKLRYPVHKIGPYDGSKYHHIRRFLNQELPVLARRNGGQACDTPRGQLKRLGFWIPNGVIQDVTRLACRHNMIAPKFVTRTLLNPLLLDCFNSRFELLGEER